MRDSPRAFFVGLMNFSSTKASFFTTVGCAAG